MILTGRVGHPRGHPREFFENLSVGAATVVRSWGEGSKTITPSGSSGRTGDARTVRAGGQQALLQAAGKISRLREGGPPGGRALARQET
jgi:hypothetical protein